MKAHNLIADRIAITLVLLGLVLASVSVGTLGMAAATQADAPEVGEVPDAGARAAFPIDNVTASWELGNAFPIDNVTSSWGLVNAFPIDNVTATWTLSLGQDMDPYLLALGQDMDPYLLALGQDMDPYLLALQVAPITPGQDMDPY